MNNENIKQITLNQYNIVGKKVDINIEQLRQYVNLEELIIKNFTIDDEYINIINSINTLKKIIFINSIFNTMNTVNKVEILKLEDCKKTNQMYRSNSIKKLYISNCEELDIERIKHLDLSVLSIEKNKIINLSEIEKFSNLEYLYLQEININENIDYSKFIKLKKLNLNGSKVENKEEYIKMLKNYNFEISFEERNLKLQ